jgi:hypothetical protein
MECGLFSTKSSISRTASSWFVLRFPEIKMRSALRVYSMAALGKVDRFRYGPELAATASKNSIYILQEPCSFSCNHTLIRD